MQKRKVLECLLRLGSILLLADIGVEGRDGLDTRDIAVSDKIVPAKEVKRLFLWIVFLKPHAHISGRYI